MKPHPRIRKTVKWGGAVVTVLLVVLWIVSWSSIVVATTPWNTAICLGRGHVLLCWKDVPPPGVEVYPTQPVLPSERRLVWRFQCSVGSFTDPKVFGLDVWVPLWAPLLLALCSSSIAWRFDTLARRRSHPHLCSSCRYNRTGLAPETICPECGTPAPRGTIPDPMPPHAPCAQHRHASPSPRTPASAPRPRSARLTPGRSDHNPFPQMYNPGRPGRGRGEGDGV